MRTTISTARATPSQAAFTLVEVMVVSVLFIMLITGLMASHLFGLKMSSVAQVKLSASKDARETLSRLFTDIRAANMVRVGTGGLNSFDEFGDGTTQAADVIQIWKSQNTNDWIRYYYVPALNTLCRTEDGLTSSRVTANSLTNSSPIFSLKTFSGILCTNRVLSPVVEINLSFTKLENPAVIIGPGSYFDFYHFQTRITPRIKQ